MPSPKLLLIADEAQGDPHAHAPEFDISRVCDLTQALLALQGDEIDCVLVSGQLRDHTRLEILESLHSAKAQVPVVFADRELTAIEAAQLARNGAHQCLGFRDSLQALDECLTQACEAGRRQRFKDRHVKSRPWGNLLVGDSRAMQEVFTTIELVGPRRCTVLITGETGTGKELAARALHMASPRGHMRMVAVNCSALPENLLEAELFGHVRGAFTGATSHRVGRFEQANKSTLFLDEIGEMPLELQAKLLRVLQERELQRLGSSDTVHVDVRVIAASNANLPEKVRQGKFREDLYYRLNVVPLRMPPLREKRGDIPGLVDHLTDKVCRSEGIAAKRVATEAKQRLCALSWPGNVRQLENSVEMAIALSGDREVLTSADFGMADEIKLPSLEPVVFPAALAESMTFEAVVANFEKSILHQALTKTRGNKTAAAELLGMKRTTLIMKLRGLQGADNLLEQAV